jgi:hypothetical protein
VIGTVIAPVAAPCGETIAVKAKVSGPAAGDAARSWLGADIRAAAIIIVGTLSERPVTFGSSSAKSSV